MLKQIVRMQLAAVAVTLALGVGTAAKADDVTLTVWSHEADEPAKVALREKAARNLEASHPGVHVKITWYEKDGLSAALKTALPAGQGPDVFYLEPDQTDYITAGYIVPLDSLVNWNNIYDWARQVWTHDGKVWGMPQEAYTVELYYNKDTLAKLGVALPANAQFTQGQFLDLVKKARAAGMTPIAQGVGDRPYPGAYVLAESLLRKLGTDDYGKLLNGQLSFEDPRVVAVFTWVKELVDAGAYPKNFMTLKLGESHHYFYQKPGSLMFPMGSFYTGRAFVPVDQGGQAPDFPLGVMQFPAMDGGACNECKTIAVGASFAINAASSRTPRRPKAETARANVCERTFFQRKSSRPKLMISASFFPNRAAGFRRRTTSMIFASRPSLRAAGSCAAHSNWLSSSRAVTRIASSVRRRSSAVSKRRYWLAALRNSARTGE